jgi:simple sugar transport system ATP-binding protein
VVANVDVSLDIYAGEIHAVVGENGAGKTTLMRMLSGSLAPDSGVLKLQGRTVHLSSPLEASRSGIGMVHQHYSVVPTFTILDNLLLSVAGMSARMITATQRRQAVDFLVEEGFEDPEIRSVAELAVDEVQRFEIAKLMYDGASILILDEPTAVLGPIEVERLYERLRALAERGRAIVVITHKLPEVERFADRVTVMRAGRTVLSAAPTPPRPELLRAMFGEQPIARAAPRAARGETGRGDVPVLTASHVVVKGRDGRERVRDVSFELMAGEVVTLLGVEGNGQSQLMEALLGVTPLSGTVSIGGEDISAASPRRRHELGVRAVTEDRHLWDVFLDAPMADNLMVHRAAAGALLGRTNTRSPELTTLAREMLQRFDVRPAEPRRRMSGFSGGNQQRAVLARECEGEKAALLLAHPTRGLDAVGSARVTDQVRQQAAEGVAVLWATADIDEALEVGDRVLVMCQGRLTLVSDTSATSRQDVARAMSGAVMVA